jgi:hypothetical protein
MLESMPGDWTRGDLWRAVSDAIRLVVLTDNQHRRLWTMRLASAYAIWIGVAGAGLMVAIAHGGEDAALGLVVVRAVTWLSWVVGGLALWAAAKPIGGEPCTVTELAKLRGYSEAAVRWSSTAAIALRITHLTATPALLLACLSLSWLRSLHAMLWTLVLCGCVAAYAVVLGASVVLLARLACATNPRHARLTALALVAVPYLAHAAWPQIPSLPTVFAWLIERLLAVGAMTA